MKTIRNLFIIILLCISVSAAFAQNITFSVQPTDQTAILGSNATFTVTASSESPITYQWRFNGVPLSYATASAFTVTNAQMYNAGAYDAVATDSSGSITSRVATLTVYSKVWTGAGDGVSWNDPNNWNAGVPGSGDVSYVGATNLTITNFSGGTIQGLECQCSLAISGSLTVNGKVRVAQWLFVAPNISITAYGASANFSCLGPVVGDQMSLSAQQGGRLSLAGLVSYYNGDQRSSALSAVGAGSVLDLPGLKTIRGPSYNDNYLSIYAVGGARVNLSAVTAISGSASSGNTSPRGTQITSEGGGSIVDLTSLQTFAGWNGDTYYASSSMYQTQGGRILVPNLAYAEAVSFSVNDGGIFSLPALTNYYVGTIFGKSLSASGTGSLLDMPALLTARGPHYPDQFLTISAFGGAQVNLGGMKTLYGSSSGVNPSARGTRILADGGGSIVNLSALESFVCWEGDSSSAASTMNQSHGGQIIVTNLSYAETVSFSVADGGSFFLPALTNYYNGSMYGRSFGASGVGSVLGFPALATIRGPNFPDQYLNITASSGAYVNLSNVQTIYGSSSGVNGNPRGTQITASGGGSIVNLSGLQSFICWNGDNSYAVSSMNESFGGIIMVPNLGYAEAVSFYVSDGGTFSVPSLTNYYNGSTYGRVFSASGTGSVLSFPLLSTIRGPSLPDQYLSIAASSGGYVNLTNVQIIYGSSSGVNGNPRGTQITASGGGSVVNLSGLQSFICWNGDNSYAVSSMSESFGGIIMVPNLGYAEALSFYVSDGGTFSVPSLTNYYNGSTYGRVFSASGAGSVLSFPALSTIRGPSYPDQYLSLAASAGGRLDLSAVRTIYGSSSGVNGNPRGTQVSATGGGSIVDLSGLQTFVCWQGDDSYAASAMSQSQGGQILAASLLYADAVSFSVTDGGIFSLPSLTNYYNGPTLGRSFSASGAGSVLNFPALVTIRGPSYPYQYFTISATSGGRINLTALRTIYGSSSGVNSNPRGTTISANGSGSIVDLSALQAFVCWSGDCGAANSSLSEGNAGKLLLPATVTFSGVTITYPIITSSGLVSGVANFAYTATLNSVGGTPAFTWSIVSNSLPAGLSLSPTTGVISGIPTTPGTSVFRVRVTDSQSRTGEATLTLLINSPDAGFTATQQMSPYVAPGQNTLSYQISYPPGRQLYLLYCEPSLPTNWTILSAQGDGHPQAQDGQIIFTDSVLPNPINFTCTVAIPAGERGTNAIGTAVTYFMNEMNDMATIAASPNPLLVPPARRHAADYADAAWVVDGIEVSWVLAYWRAQAYHIASNLRDGFAVGIGNTNGARHSADFESPFWSINGTELNRVLSYWRAGSYHPDTNGVDGYAPGPLVAGATSILTDANTALSQNQAAVTQTSSDLYLPGGFLNVTNTIEYNGSLLSFLLRPMLPAGWTLQSVSGGGNPQAVAGEIVLTGTIPPSPFQIVYTAQIPSGNSSTVEVGNDFEYQFAGMANPVLNHSPGALIGTVKLQSPTISGSQVQFSLAGEPNRTYLIQTSTNLVDWVDLTTITVSSGSLNVTLPTIDSRMFVRAQLSQ